MSHAACRLLASLTITSSLLHCASQGKIQTVDPRTAEIEKLNKDFSSLIHQGHYAEAIPVAREQLALVESLYGPAGSQVAIPLHNLAVALYYQGAYAESRPVYQRTLEIQERALGPDHPDVARTLGDLAVLLDTQGDSSAAKAAYERALAINEKNLGSNDLEVAASLSNLAAFLYSQGDFTVARSMLERAIRIYEKAAGPDSQHTAEALMNLASVLDALHESPLEQRKLYERAVAIYEKNLGPDHPQVAMALRNLGAFLGSQKDWESARSLLERALAIYEKNLGSRHPDYAACLMNLAGVLEAQGNFAAAQPWYQEALEILQDAYGPEHPQVAVALRFLAHLKLAQEDYRGAQELCERALAIVEKTMGPTNLATADALNNLASVLVQTGKIAEAKPLLERSLNTYTSILGPEHPQVANVRTNLAVLRWREGDARAAREMLLAASASLENHIRQVLPGLSLTEQRAFIADGVPVQTSLLLSACRDGEDLRQAYGIVSHWKGLLVDSLRRQALVTRLGKNPELRDTAERLRLVRSRIAGWFSLAGKIPYPQWKEKNDLLTREKEGLERALNAGGEAWNTDDPLDESQARGGIPGALAPGDALADIYQYSFYASGLKTGPRYAAVVTVSGATPFLVDLGPVEDIHLPLRAWRLAVLTRSTEQDSWHLLARRIWAPLAARLPKSVRRLWVSPDGELARLPWQLLPPSDARTAALQLSQIDSARELLLVRRSRPSAPGSPAWLLAGGIDFDTAGGGQGKFPPLPGTSSEVENLAVLGRRKHLETTLLTGRAATKETLVTRLAGAAYVHLATHGFFRDEPGPSSRNPLVESGLALAGANASTLVAEQAEGLLTAEELAGLDLSRCELLVLSACDTGRGEEVTGQGVLGLRSVVMAAGAKSLVMSLWKVPDDATARLMNAFYDNLWDQGYSRLGALLAAQKTVRNDPRFRAPVNWAGWVLVGEGW